MNEYLYNIQTHTAKDTFTFKSIPKYRMGWKITPSKYSIELLLNSSNKTDNKTDNKLNLSNGFIINDNLENIDSNNNSHQSKSKHLLKKKYNIYEKYPEYFPELSEQGDIDSCVPSCISTIYYYNTFKQGNHLNFRISRLFLYYNVRKIYNELSDDGGSRIIDCIEILKKTGVPPEIVHPYHEKLIYKKPNKLSVKLAKYCRLLEFKELNKHEIKNNLLINNLIICGIKIYENFNNQDTIENGQVIMPSDDEEILGGHSIVIVGYDEEKKNYIFLNSWGKSWGDEGFGYIPYDYIENRNLADEFFILKKITNPIINLFDDNTNNNTLKQINNLAITNNLDKSLEIIKILILSILIIIQNL
jgi:C1A family cysteine protease